MPKVVDLQHADDPRDVIHEAVEHLAAGRLVIAPTETGYVALAAALNIEGIKRLESFQKSVSGEPCVLFLKSAAEAWDYLPQMSPLGRKLSRRCWPGPVVLCYDAPTAGGLLDALPAETRTVLKGNGTLPLRVPAHDILQEILRLSPAPLVSSGEAVTSGSGGIFKSINDVPAAARDEVALIIDDGPARYNLPATVVRVTGDEWQIAREGVVTERTIGRLAGDIYLFVCTGNTCRSPMAEAMFRKMLSDKLQCAEEDLVDRGYVVASAGLAAAMGAPPSPEAVQVLREAGIDLQSHESQPVTPQLLYQADRVFTMTQQHREWILREFPELEPLVKLLATSGRDISDPIGSGLEQYEKCAKEIEEHLRAILGKISLA